MENENTVMTDIKVNETGKVSFAPDVIATIANLAASDVEGGDCRRPNCPSGVRCHPLPWRHSRVYPPAYRPKGYRHTTIYIRYSGS